MTLFIDESTVAATADIHLALDAVESAHRALALGRADDTPRARTRTPQSSLHILQGALLDEGMMGYKAYTASREGTRFWVHLFDMATGAPLAVVEAGQLGVLRTGAAAGVATRCLARADARVLGVFGAGTQAGAQIEAVCAVRPITEVRVFARRPGPLAQFCAAMEDRLGRPVTPARSAREVVEGADVITTVTTAATPLFEADWVSAGAHINAAGSNALTRRELDEATLRRASLICVDARDTAVRESGDLLPLLEKGRTHPRSWVELGEILTHQRPARVGEADITVFESQGLAVQDLALAWRIVQAVKAG